MLTLEFHCHTIFSKDSLTSPEKLIETCRRKGVDRVVVTDHNTIAGALAAQKLDPQRVIVGEEVMTTGGELLAAFVTEEVPPFLSPHETIRRLKEQGAYISVSHPFDRLRSGAWREEDLLAILPQVDAIEVFNSRCMNPRFNREAQVFARRHGVAGTVGSDAHAALEVGRSLLLVEQFEGPDGMRRVVPSAILKTRLSPLWVHFLSRYAVLYKAWVRS
jgi:predicted metal-dependent phosphoesterase TrpH